MVLLGAGCHGGVFDGFAIARVARFRRRDAVERRRSEPIELAFAKLKAFLRAARPHSFDQVVDLTAIALQLFTPRDCLNFVRHCSYRIATEL